MNAMNGWVAYLLAVLMLAPAAAWGKAEQNNKLVFGVIAPRGVEAAAKNWRPLIDAMSMRLQMPVDAVVASDFKEIVAGMKEGKIDLAWLGNVGALEVVESGKGSVFAQMITKTGSTGYRSVLIVHKDSRIQALADVLKPNNGLVFGDGDLKSTSGHAVPLYYAFVKNKVNDPASLFKEIKVGNHRTNLIRTAQKEVDVATSNTEEIQFFANEQPELHARLRVIWTSPEIPQSPLVWRRDLPGELKRKISKFITTYGKNSEAERQALLQANELGGFRKSSNRQLITVSDLEMFNERLKLWNSRTLPEGDKHEQEQKLILRASRLELFLRLDEEF